MITEKELKKAIKDCENMPATYETCKKLATFNYLYDRMYSNDEYNYSHDIKSEIVEEIVDTHGNSEFLEKISGKPSRETWIIIDELMNIIKLINPKLYSGVMNKI